MNAKFKVGDTIYIKNGINVWTTIPEKFVYTNTPFSQNFTTHNIEVGKKYTTIVSKRNLEEEVNHISNLLWKSFLNCYFEVDFKTCKDFVENQTKINNKIDNSTFIIKEGEFIIENVHYHPKTEGYGHINYSPEYYSYKARRKNGGKLADIVEVDEYDI